jgi:hypothetical protein
MYPTIRLPRGVRQVGTSKFRAQIRDHDGRVMKLNVHDTPDAAHEQFVAESLRLYGNLEARLPDGITRKKQREQRRATIMRSI